MSRQRQIAERLIQICVENDLFIHPKPDMALDEIGDLKLLDCPWFDSMALVFLQSEIESEWGVNIPAAQFVGWLRTLNQIAGHIVQRLPAHEKPELTAPERIA